MPMEAGTPPTSITLDAPNHGDYILTHIWAGTGDWPSHNYYAAGRRLISTGWKFFCWDAEFSIYYRSDLNRDISTTAGPQGIFGELRRNAEFRLLFADQVQRHLFGDGCMTPGPVAVRWHELVSIVQPAIVAEAARWGSASTPSAWNTQQQDVLNNYMPNRTGIVVSQLKAQGLYPTVDAPGFSQQGGVFELGFELAMTAEEDIHYTLDGSDPRESTGPVRRWERCTAARLP